MIWILNRKELTVVQDPSEVNRIEKMLESHGIPFRTVREGATGITDVGRLRGLPGIRENLLYHIYVHKDALEYASYLIRNQE